MVAPVRAVSVLLLLSGMCALVFQTAWLRELRLIFGASTPASGAVLAIFIGALGLGNVLLGRKADASTNPLRLYALLEMGTSALAMLGPLLIPVARAIYIGLGGQEALGPLVATTVRLLLAALILGPPAFLMGGTLPAAVRAAMPDDDQNRGAAGLLYGVNTIGAVLGALLSTFFLLEWLGTRMTLWAACGIGLVNGIAAWQIGRQRLPALPAQETSVGQNRLWYLVAAGVGFSFFLMELVWYRMLAPILGGTTFTLGLILAVALAGIGVGGAVYPLAFRSRSPSTSSLALTLGYEALALGIPFALGDRLALLAGRLRPLGEIGFGGQVFGWLLVTLIVVFPAALVSGIQFPLLVALIGKGNARIGKELGFALGINSLGAMIGAVGGGFGLLTALSATGAWMVVVVILALSAIGLSILDLRQTRRFAPLVQPVVVVALAIMCLWTTGPTALWRHSGIGGGRADIPLTTKNDLQAWINASRRNIFWEVDGRESSVAVSTDRGVGFVVNGKNDGNAVNDAGTQIMLGVLGALLHPQPRTGLVIGLGTGESAGWLAEQADIESVDVVEIEPAIIHVAEACAPLNHDVVRHPKVRIVVNDAREYLATTRRKYDVIASEPSNPYRSGVASLYTREFYRSVGGRLNERGIFLQWLQGYEVDDPTVRSVLCTLSEVFRHVEIWETNPADLLLVCSVEPLAYAAADLRARMETPAMREALRVAWRTTTLEGVVSHFVANEDFVHTVTVQGAGFVNADDRNLLEYRFARTMGSPGTFTVNGLRAEAAAKKVHRPSRLEGELDWEEVEDARIAYHAAAGDSPLSPSLFAGDRAKRAEALLAFQSRDGLASVVKLWDLQPRAPRDLTETLAVALGAAANGDERATRIVEPIRGTCPIERDFVLSLLAARQHRTGDAAPALVAVLDALRRDPTPFPLIADQAVQLALEISSHDPVLIPRLYEALRAPFALRVAEDGRVTALCLLASAIGPREAAEAFEDAEPNPRWNERMLELRFQAYERSGHKLAEQARRDLEQFQRQAGSQKGLPSEHGR